jgi:hypothetical protein
MHSAKVSAERQQQTPIAAASASSLYAMLPSTIWKCCMSHERRLSRCGGAEFEVKRMAGSGRERQRVAGQKPFGQRHWTNECKVIVSSAVEIRLHSEAKALQMWSKMWSNYPEHAPQISL